MPANLPPPYKNAEARFRAASTTEDKITAIQEMMALCPKHKGTDHVRANLRRRLSRLKMEQLQSRKKGRSGPSYHIPKEEAPQVVLIGTPNVGKSQIVVATTNATPEVANYPFTTRTPQPAMMPYRDIYIQLVDIPPLSPEHIDAWVPEIIRNADVGLVVLDLAAADCVDAFIFLRKALAEKSIRLSPVHDPTEEEPPRNVKQVLIVANKLDSPKAEENLEFLREIIDGEFEVYPICAELGQGIPELQDALFKMLDVIRIYSKVPGKDVDMKKPFIVPRGSNVMDVAQKIHREFAEHLKSARIWGSGKHDGVMAKRNHILQDGDIIELHL